MSSNSSSPGWYEALERSMKENFPMPIIEFIYDHWAATGEQDPNNSHKNIQELFVSIMCTNRCGCTYNKPNKQIFEFLLSKGADINGKNRDGRTAIYRATCACSMDIVQILLELGADPTITSNGRDCLYECNNHSGSEWTAIRNLLSNYRYVQQNKELRDKCDSMEAKMDQMMQLMVQQGFPITQQGDLPHKKPRQQFPPGEGPME